MRGPELAAQLASGGADAREASYAELLAIEVEHHRLHVANAGRGGGGGGVAIHVGGLEGPELEDETALASLFGRFGTVLAATLRVRREVKHGKVVVSWALVSFSSAGEADAALAGSADLTAQHKDLVTRAVDEVQAAHSTGAMGDVMRTHVLARAAALRASQSTDDVAKAIAVASAVSSNQHALVHRTLRRVRRKSFRHRPFEESPACSSGVVTACAKNDRALLLPAQQQPPVRVSESRACRLDEGERRGGTNELNEAGVCTHIGS